MDGIRSEGFFSEGVGEIGMIGGSATEGRRNREGGILSVESLVSDICRKRGRRISGYRIGNISKRPLSVIIPVYLEYGDGEKEILYIKHLSSYGKKKRANRVKEEYDAAMFWYLKLRGSRIYRAVEPVYCDPGKYVIVTKAVSQPNLMTLIRRDGQGWLQDKTQARLFSHMRMAGEWLRYFQNLNRDERGNELSLERLFAYVDLRLKRLVENRRVSFSESLRRQILLRIRSEWTQCDQMERKECYVHGDFSLSNVLTDGVCVTVLDFKGMQRESIHFDVARFYHQLSLLENKPTIRKAVVQGLKDNFLMGYGIPRADSQPMFRIYGMVHAINHLSKNSRAREGSFWGDLYNRWVVRNSLRKLTDSVQWGY